MDKKWILSVVKSFGDPGDLFFEKDFRLPEDELVHYNHFTWYRNKSNACVKSNGFSFYYAAQVDYDGSNVSAIDRDSPNMNENSRFLIGYPFGDYSEGFLVVVHLEIKGSGVLHILSAYEAAPWHEEEYNEVNMFRKRVRDSLVAMGDQQGKPKFRQ